ncbi:LON peptidase N-terminal domain and RING finger protein 1-like [Megalops cyprinoides]|uniref:LON peptidase N-terminal domain and RING finger protein 1-like n=1 Tax=Megalops cyprinoides TaxID=118141 RepID=UPI001863CEED|nr:LON peptidase N-terminal domain and RING finger protein 1-like [Megalops cyprinoides]
MSVPNSDAEEILEEKAGFFIAPSLDSEWEDDTVDHQRLILQRADALASENRLKEALDAFSTALRYGSVRPEQLSTLLDCVLRNFKKRAGDAAAAQASAATRGFGRPSTADAFSCPACHRFLGEAVTVACGHSYCKRCLQRDLFTRCKLCNEELADSPGGLRPNVILCSLLEKWFPDDTKRCKTAADIEDLSKQKRFEEAATLANNALESDPGDTLARTCRAEAFAGLEQYQSALSDLEVLCVSSAHRPEAYFLKAGVLKEMGQVDEALQVYLHCLALDEDFKPAKKEVEKIFHELLSPAAENVKVGLRETAQSTSHHLRSKTLVADAQTAPAPPRPDPEEKRGAPSRSESLERPGLSRAQSLRTHGPPGGAAGGEEGLKRVCSAPQLGDQEKGTLLKRKLSASEAGSSLIHSQGNKHKKQGEAGVAAKHTSVPSRTIPVELLEANDFECSLCMRLFYEPVTTPCGHTFCKSCLERCLDHTPQCPLCKESLKVYLASRKYNVTSVLENVMKQYLTEEHLERQKSHTEETKELSDLTKSVPIFVCTMAYPTVPCPLHVFEPRYRLMIRRCMETGTKQFGMCANDPRKGFADYGCMLQIRSLHFLPDGRSVVDTVGGKRFRVLSRSMKDGYCIADIQYLEDVRVDDAEELSKLQELHDQVYEQARTWFQNLKNRFRGQILQHFGPMPEREADIQATPNGPACCWWLLAVLPVDPRYQLSVLSMMSLRERLVKIQHILTYLQSIPSE